MGRGFTKEEMHQIVMAALEWVGARVSPEDVVIDKGRRGKVVVLYKGHPVGDRWSTSQVFHITGSNERCRSGWDYLDEFGTVLAHRIGQIDGLEV